MAIPWASIGNVASAIGSVSNLFGGGSKENTGLINANNAKQLDLQEMALRDPIKLRVRDAREAGLHPLYALGASPASVVPQFMSSGAGYSGESVGDRLQSMGQNLSQLQTPGMTAEQRQIHDANLKAIEASTTRDNSQAAYYAAMAARESQAKNATAPQPTVTGAPRPGMVQGQPDQVTSVKKENQSVTAGNHAAFKDAIVIGPDGQPRTIAVPNPDILQDQEAIGYGLFAYENSRRWINQLKKDARSGWHMIRDPYGPRKTKRAPGRGSR